MTDVVAVVGAGLSGLIAARAVADAGIDVVVLEAADRIGGRALTETTALGSHVDLGGQWIGHDHHRLKALATALGATEYTMHTGRVPRLVDGSRRLSPASPAVVGAAAALAAAANLPRLNTLRWNDVAVGSWLRKIPGRRCRRLLEVVALTSWTADPDQLSVHAVAAMLRRQGGLSTALGTTGGAQESLLVEGVGSLAERLAAGLGDRVRTGWRVTAIMRDDDGATIRTSAGEIRANRVIVTAPPPTAAAIVHEPALPRDRVALQQNTFMGTVYKAIAVYDRPFWRDLGAAELLVLGSPGFAVFDSSPPGGPGHLCMLVSGGDARHLDVLDAAARRTALLGELAPHLGASVLTHRGWHEKSWHLDEFAGGGYVALPVLGTTEGLPPMPSRPVGVLHWAGSETASEHPGYFDGAVEAGDRAAREVIAALAR